MKGRITSILSGIPCMKHPAGRTIYLGDIPEFEVIMASTAISRGKTGKVFSERGKGVCEAGRDTPRGGPRKENPRKEICGSPLKPY